MQAVSDRTNPVVVKELRQAVQSRLVIAILLLFLLVNVLIVSGYLMLERRHRDERAGRPGSVRRAVRRAGGDLHGLRAVVCRGSFDDGAQRLEHRPAVHHHDRAGRDHSRQILGGRGADRADLQRLACPF